jgi:hypothetical protein
VSKSRMALLMFCKLLTHVFFGAWRFKPRKLEHVEAEAVATELPALPSAGVG